MVSRVKCRIGVRWLVYRVEPCVGDRRRVEARVWDVERCVVSVVFEEEGSWKAQKSITWVPWVLIMVILWCWERGTATEDRAGIVCVWLGG